MQEICGVANNHFSYMLGKDLVQIQKMQMYGRTDAQNCVTSDMLTSETT